MRDSSRLACEQLIERHSIPYMYGDHKDPFETREHLPRNPSSAGIQGGVEQAVCCKVRRSRKVRSFSTSSTAATPAVSILLERP